jgi:hypothetical protein
VIRRAWGLTLTLVLTVLAHPVGAGEMMRTDSRHMVPVPDVAEPGNDRLPPMLWSKTPQVVMRSSVGWRKGGKVNKLLTLACRDGRFGERISMLYRAVFKDDVLGVAFGHGLNLYDPDHRADRATIYLFRFGGLNDCQVLTMPNPDPSVQGGTSRQAGTVGH